MAKPLVVLREAAAGAVTACVALPLSVASGILVYSQFGADYLALAAIAGVGTAIVGGAVASLLNGSPLVKSIPAKSAVIQANIVAGMAASFGSVDVALAVFPLCIILASVWQIGLAFSGLSKVVNMTPYPVIAGFVSGVGLLIILGQIPIFIDVPSLADVTSPANLSFSRLLLAAGVLSAIFALERFAPKIPAPLIGLIVGYAIYHLIVFAAPHIDVGLVVGAIDISAWASFDLEHLILHLTHEDAKIWYFLLGGSLVLALSGTLDTAVAIEFLRRMDGAPVDQKRDLVSQGVASVAVAAGGGLFVTNSLALTAVNHHAGGQTRWSAFLGAVFLFAGVAVFPQIVYSLPLVVLAAILIYVGVRLIDPWVIDACRQAIFSANSPVRRHLRRNAAIAVAVMAVTVFEQPLLGAAVGAFLALAVFVAQMNRPAVRKSPAPVQLKSKRKRSFADEALLDENSDQLVVLHLQGVLFFANASDIRTEIESLPEAVETVILDFRDITDIDISGAVALRQACDWLRKKRRQVLFCNLRDRYVEHAIRDMATDEEVLADLDAALQRFEDGILSRLRGGEDQQLEARLIDSDLGRLLEPDQMMELKETMRHAEFPAGTALCRAGEPADRLWVLTQGSVSVWAAAANGPKRLASIGAGCVVGEMGLLDGRPRSADVVADEAVHAYELTAEAFRMLLTERPQLGQAVTQALARELAERLRVTSAELQRADR